MFTFDTNPARNPNTYGTKLVWALAIVGNNKPWLVGVLDPDHIGSGIKFKAAAFVTGDDMSPLDLLSNPRKAVRGGKVKLTAVPSELVCFEATYLCMLRYGPASDFYWLLTS